MRVADENMRHERGPTDSERARFGFTKRPSVVDLSTLSALATPCRSTSTFTIGKDASPEATEQAGLLRKVEEILGDPDDTLKLCRSKLTAKKFDFRSRITELTEQNQALKRGLMQKREQHNALVSALIPMEAKRAYQLEFFKEKAQERGNLSQELKENLREYHEQYVRPLGERNVNVGTNRSPDKLVIVPPTAGDSCDVAKERDEICKAAYDILKRAGEAERRRADSAERRADLAEEKVADLEEQVQELKKELSRSRKAVREHACCLRGHGEAEKLLALQIEQATSARAELLRIAQERQNELLREIAALKARLRTEQKA